MSIQTAPQSCSTARPVATKATTTTPAPEATPVHYCGTCLVPAGSPDETVIAQGLAPLACPDCGVRSLDYAYLAETEALLASAQGLEALDAAVFLLG